MLHSTEGGQERRNKDTESQEECGVGGRKGKGCKEILWVPLADKYLPSPVRNSGASSSPPQREGTHSHQFFRELLSSAGSMLKAAGIKMESEKKRAFVELTDV